MCRTRWVERHEAFQVFSDLFIPVFCCLEAVYHGVPHLNGTGKAKQMQSFLLAMSQFPFIIALQATQNILAYTKGLSVKLQGRYTDIARAYREIETVKSAIQTARTNINSCHNIVYTQAKSIAGSVGIEESVPRLASRQQHCSNVAAENCSQYYQHNLTIPLLDHLITQTSTQHTIELMNWLPSTITDSSTVLQCLDFKKCMKMTYHLQSVLKQNSIYGNVYGKYLKKKLLYPLIPQRKFFHMLIRISTPIFKF